MPVQFKGFFLLCLIVHMEASVYEHHSMVGAQTCVLSLEVGPG